MAKMTQAALAAALGLTEGRVAQLKAAGMPITSLAEAQAWREARQNLAQRKPLPTGANLAPIVAAAAELTDKLGECFDAARTRRERAAADLAELELQRQRGNLVELDQILGLVERRVSTVRESLLNVGARLGPMVAAESDLDRVVELIDSEIRQALQILSDRFYEQSVARSKAT